MSKHAKTKTILAICGSASSQSANLWVLKYLQSFLHADFDLEIIDDLSQFSHFQTGLSDGNEPNNIAALRNTISNSNAVIICTPEYVFSIPSGLKNILEWCVSTDVFANKPTGLITASANGEKGHEELQLIMKTIQANFTKATTLLIPGIKGKIDKEGKITDQATAYKLSEFAKQLSNLIKSQLQ